MYLLQILQIRNIKSLPCPCLQTHSSVHEGLGLYLQITWPHTVSFQSLWHIPVSSPICSTKPLQSGGCAGYGRRLCREPCSPAGGRTPSAQPGLSTGQRHFTMLPWYTPVSPQREEEHFTTTWPDTSSAAQDCVHPARHTALMPSSWPMLPAQRCSVWIAASCMILTPEAQGRWSALGGRICSSKLKEYLKEKKPVHWDLKKIKRGPYRPKLPVIVSCLSGCAPVSKSHQPSEIIFTM